MSRKRPTDTAAEPAEKKDRSVADPQIGMYARASEALQEQSYMRFALLRDVWNCLRQAFPDVKLLRFSLAPNMKVVFAAGDGQEFRFKETAVSAVDVLDASAPLKFETEVEGLFEWRKKGGTSACCGGTRATLPGKIRDLLA